MKVNGNAVVTAVLVVCAVITTSIVVRREWLASQANRTGASQPTLVQNWEAALAVGKTVGPAGAAVKLVEFADYQCPYCASFHTTLKAIQKQYPRDVAVTFMHHPLLMHSHAEAAARAAECAAEQDRFSAMHDYMFENQDALGKAPWTELARAAGVADASQFDECMTSSPVVDARIQAHKDLGNTTFGVRATPTLIINGWKLGAPPDRAALDKMVQAALAGKAPVEKKNVWSLLANDT